MTTAYVSDREIPRSRSTLGKLRDLFAAYLRLDIVEEFMFPASNILVYLALLVPAFMFYFQARFLHTHDQYMATLVGVAVAAGLQEALTGLTSRLQFAQERGVLETYLIEPISWRLIPLGMNIWKSFTGTVAAFVTIAIGWGLGGALRPSGIPGFIALFVLGVLASNGLGLFAASFLILFKRGTPVIAVYGLLGALVGGSLFSITVLPVWIRWASYLAPQAYVISGARSLLTPEAGPAGMPLWLSFTVLGVGSVLAMAAGLWVFERSLQRAKAMGILGT